MNKERQSIADYYASHELRPEIVHALAGRVRARRTNTWMKVAASLVLLLGVGYAALSVYQDYRLGQNIRNEIAVNHRKAEPLDVSGPDLAFVESRLDRIDFSVRSAGAYVPQTYVLEGARYCSVQGTPAVLLRYVHETERHYMTVYVAPAEHDWASLSLTENDENGVRVRIWQTQGLFVASAVDREANRED